MSFDEICAFDAAQFASDNCALFLWSLNSMLPQSLDVITSWGFKFVTIAFTWAKRTPSDNTWHMGMGYWTRQNTEHCLLATKGNPKRLARDVRQLLIAPRREHSRKPDEIYGRVERLVGGPYIELFARETRVGWDCTGEQSTLFNNGHVPTRRQPSNLRRRAMLDIDL